MRRNSKAFIVALIMVGAFWCLFGYVTEAQAEGGSSSSPSITITESKHGDNLATVDLSKDGTIATIDFSYTIEPTRVGTYEVYVGTESATLTGKDHYDENSDAKLTSMSGSVMNAKEWGYRTSALVPVSSTPTIDDNTSYKAMTIVDTSTRPKTYGEQMKDTSNNTTISGSTITKLAVQVAAKGDATLPADKYQGKIILSVVATPKTTVRMQMMDMSDCGDGATPVEMEDERDGKIYLVQKLADGNCWMVQNLALAGGTELESTKSNLNSGQTYIVPTSTQSFSTSGTPQQMFNGSHEDGKPDTAGCWPTSGKTVAEYCTASAKTGNNNNNSGAYYSWDAATAGKYTGVSSGEATQSICPKKWTLPSGNKANTVDKSFNKLYAGVAGSGYASNKTNFDAVWQPGYGRIVVGSSLSGNDAYCYWWSSTISNTSNAYSLYEDAGTGINLSSSDDRRRGLAVRCVFKG